MANDYNRPNEFDRPNEIEQSSDRNLEPTPNKDKKHAKKAGDGTMGFMLWSIAGTVLAACSSPIFSDVADLTGGGGSSGDTQGGSPGFVTNGRWANTDIYVADENGFRVDESGTRDPNADAVGITDGAGNIIFNDEYITRDTLGNGERYMADLEGATEISTGRRGMSGEELLSLPYHGGVLIISPLTDLLANAYIEAAPQDMTREEFYQVTLDAILGQRPQFDATTGDAITGTESSIVTVEDVLNADNYNPFADNNIAAELVSLASTTLGLIEEEASDTSATERVEALTNSLDDTRGQLMTEADEDVLSFTLDSDSSIRGIDDLDGDVNARVADAVARGGLPVVGTPNGGEAIRMTEGENFVLSRANSNPVLLFGFEDPFDNDVDGQPGGEREPGQLVGIYIEAASMGGDIAVMFGDDTNNVALAGADRVAASDAAIPAMTTVGGVTFYFVSEANLDRLVLRPTDGDFNTADESVNNPQIRFYVHDGEHATLADGATTLDGVGMLEIEVANVNDAPVVNPPAAVSITSTSDSDLSGTFTASDADGDMDFRWSATPTSTPYGEFSFPDPANPGAWTFTLNEAAFDALPAGMDVPLTFDITANDGNGGVSDAATLTIMLQGQNDAPTDITTSVAALVAGYDHAGIPSNGIFIATLSTVDADTGDTHTYTRGGVDGQYFSIRDGSGTESTDGTHLWLDSDAPGRVVGGTWEVVVTSTDSANAATSKTFSITRADASTNLAPTDITTTATGTSAALTATYDGNNVPDGGNGGHVVATLGTTDPNTGDTHTYSIVPVTGEASESFDINGNELILSVSASPAPGDMLEVTVRSTDAGGLMVDKTFTITRAGNADTATDTLAIASEGARTHLLIYGVEFRALEDGASGGHIFFPVNDGGLEDVSETSDDYGIHASTYSQASIADIWNTDTDTDAVTNNNNGEIVRQAYVATIIEEMSTISAPAGNTLAGWRTVEPGGAPVNNEANGRRPFIVGTDEADLVVTEGTSDLTARGWLQVTGATGDITFSRAGGTGSATLSGQLGSAAHTDTREYTFAGDYGDLVIDGDGDWVYTLGGTTAQNEALAALQSGGTERFVVAAMETGGAMRTVTETISIIVNEAPAPLAVSSEGVRQHIFIYGVEFRALEDDVGTPAGIFFNNAGAETVTATGARTLLTYGIRASSFSQADIARIWNTDTTSSTNEGNSGGAFVATIIEEMSGINTLAQWRIMETGGAEVTTSNGFRLFTAGTDDADRVVTEGDDLTASGWLQVTGGTGDITFGKDATSGFTASGQLGGASGTAAHTDTRTYTFVGDYGDLVIDGDGDWVYTLGGVANSANAATYQTNINGLNSAGTETFEVEITRGGEMVDQDIMITVNIAADGANEAPTLSAPIPADNDVTEDDTGDATVTGALTFDDPDAGQDKSNLRVYVAAGATATDASTEVAPGATGADTEVPVVGTYGSFMLTRTMAGDVTWTYTLDHTDADTQALGHGQSVTDQLAVIVYDAAGVDSGGEVITIDVTGVNDAPVVDSLLDAAITITDSGVPGADSRVTTGSLTGTFTVTDDMGDTHTFTTRGHGGAVGVQNGERSDDGFTHSVNGRYGMLFYDDQSGAYEYVPDETEIDALNDGDQPGDPFAIFATDNSGQANNMSTATPLLNVTIIGANEVAALEVESEGVREHILVYGVEFRASADGNLPVRGIFFPANTAAADRIVTSGTYLGIEVTTYSQANIARIWNTDDDSNAYVATIIEEMSTISAPLGNTLAGWRTLEPGLTDASNSGTRDFTLGTDEADREVTEGSDLTASGWLQVTGGTGDITFGKDATSGVTVTGQLGGASGAAAHTDTREYTYAGIYGDLVIDGDGDWVYTLGGTDAQNNALAALASTDTEMDPFTVEVSRGDEMEELEIEITVNGVNDDVAPDSLTVESEGMRQHLLIYGVEFRALEDSVGAPGGIYFNNAGVETVTVTGVTGSFSYGIRASSFSQADIARIWNTDTTSSTNEGNSGGAFVATIIEEMSINMLAEWRAMEDGGAEVTTDNGFRRFISGTDDADLMVTEDNDLTASGWLQVTGGTGDITFGKDATSGVTVTGQLGGASGAAAHTDTREYTYAGIYGDLVIDGDGDWVYTLGGTDAQNNALAALASTDTEMDPFTVEVSRGDEMEELEIEITVNGADNLTVTNEAVRAFVIVNGVEFRVNTDGDERTAYEIDFGSTSTAGRVNIININNDDVIELRATSSLHSSITPSDLHFSQANIARLFNAANLANLEVAAIILEGNDTNALANWDSSEDDTRYDFITASTALDLAVTEDDEADSTAHGFLEVTGGTGTYTYSGDFEGIYGDLIVDGDGNWTYVLNNTDDDTQALIGGQDGTDSFTIIVSDSSSPAIMGRQQIEITVNGADEVSPLTVESEGMRTHLLIYGVEFRQLVDGDDVVGGNNGVIFFPDNTNSAENIAHTTDGFGINTLTYSQANIANLWNTYTDNGNIVTQGLVATIIEENDIDTLTEWRTMEDGGAGVRGTFATRDFTLGTDEADTMVTEGSDLTASGWLHVTDTTTGDITFGEDETNGVTVTGQLGGASGSAAHTDTRKYTYAGIYGNLVIDGDGDWVYTLGGSEVQNNALAALTSTNGGTDPFEVTVRETGGAMRRKTEMIEIAVTGADVPAFATSRSGTMVTITDTDRAADNVPAPVTGTISLTAETDDTDLTWTIAEPTVTGTNEDAGHFGGFSLTSRPLGFSSGSILENIGRELEWTFTPRNINDLNTGESVVITRSITIMNGDGMANQDLVITVNGFTPLFEDDGLTPITGAAGNEDLEGMDSGSANELIQGGDGRDIIETLGGNDVVIGGSGIDDITLGDPSVPAQAGAETVVYRFESDGDRDQDGGWTATDNYDVIRNFERGTDKLVLVDVHNQDGMGTGTPIASLDDLIADTNDRPVVNVVVDADSSKITHISIVFEVSAVVSGDIFSRTIEVSLASDTRPDLTDFSIDQSDNNRLTDYDQLAELFGGEEFLLVGDASQLPDGLEIL